MALAAIALELGLGALIATDARAAAGLAWYGTAASLVILTVGLVAASSGTVQSSVALLGALLLLLRHQDRLVLAPLYGACLLVAGELAQRSLELRGQQRIGPAVIGLRVAAVLVLAALGACAAALAAIAVTIAPARSVAFTAVGTLAALAASALIVLLAQQRSPENRREGGTPSDGRPPAPGP
jgi:hypothetical protein